MRDVPTATKPNWRSRLAAPLLGALMVACCLAAPLLAGAVGSVATGSILGVGAGVLVLTAVCLLVASRLTAGGKKC